MGRLSQIEVVGCSNQLFWIVKRYFDLLEEKANLEKELRRQKEYPEGTLFCSFCGKSEKEAKRMIAGPFKVQICDECVQLCGEILAEPYEGEE